MMQEIKSLKESLEYRVNMEARVDTIETENKKLKELLLDVVSLYERQYCFYWDTRDRG